MLLSKSYLNFFFWFQAPIGLSFFLISNQELLPPSHRQKHWLILFLSSCLSLQLLYFMYYSTHTLLCMLLFNLLHIYILFSFILIQLIFNLIFLCIILPALGTIDWEKHDICFSPQKGHLKPSLLYIHSSNIFFSVVYECIKNRNDITLQFGMRSIRLQTLKIKLKSNLY